MFITAKFDINNITINTYFCGLKIRQRGMRWEGATVRRACTTGGFIKPHSFPLRPGRIALSLGGLVDLICAMNFGFIK